MQSGLADFMQQGNAVHLGEHQVQNHHIRSDLGRGIQRLLAVAALDDAEGIGEGSFQRQPEVFTVVYNHQG